MNLRSSFLRIRREKILLFVCQDIFVRSGMLLDAFDLVALLTGDRLCSLDEIVRQSTFALYQSMICRCMAFATTVFPFHFAGMQVPDRLVDRIGIDRRSAVYRVAILLIDDRVTGFADCILRFTPQLGRRRTEQ